MRHTDSDRPKKICLVIQPLKKLNSPFAVEVYNYPQQHAAGLEDFLVFYCENTFQAKTLTEAGSIWHEATKTFLLEFSQTGMLSAD